MLVKIGFHSSPSFESQTPLKKKKKTDLKGTLGTKPNQILSQSIPPKALRIQSLRTNPHKFDSLYGCPTEICSCHRFINCLTKSHTTNRKRGEEITHREQNYRELKEVRKMKRKTET